MKAWTWFKDQSRTVKVIIVVALVAVAGNLMGDSEETVEAAETPTTTTEAPTTTVAETTTTTEATTTTAPPTTTTAVSTGDWPSVDAYLADLLDTGEKVVNILTITSDSAASVANGEISLISYALIMDTAIETLDSHRDYFRGTTPPSGFEDSHRLYLTALDRLNDSFVLASEGAWEEDISKLERSIGAMNEATDLFYQAASAIPSA